MNTSTCRTCRYWDQRYPENTALGVCLQMGAHAWGTELAVLVSSPMHSNGPTSDFEAVRTGADFGCICHSDNYPGIPRRLEQSGGE